MIFDIVCRDWMILMFFVFGCCDCCLFCGMGVGCDCVACVAAEPAPSLGHSMGDAGAAAFAALKAIDALLERNRQVCFQFSHFHFCPDILFPPYPLCLIFTSDPRS